MLRTHNGGCRNDSIKKQEIYSEFSTKELSLKDLSDLCWAANGINRPESGKERLHRQ